MSEACFACGGQFELESDGAQHAYMLSSPGCWAAYGRVLEREYSDPVLFGAAHRLTVDAYALQHPGDPGERRALQSFWLHGASLWLVLKMEQSHSCATQALKTFAGRAFPERPVGERRFKFTHAELLAAPISDHAKLARIWAEDALFAWPEAHPEFATLARSAVEA